MNTCVIWTFGKHAAYWGVDGPIPSSVAFFGGGIDVSKDPQKPFRKCIRPLLTAIFGGEISIKGLNWTQ